MSRDRAAIAIVAGGIAAGLLGVVFGRYDAGIVLRADDQGRYVVDEVAHLSQAERDGVRPGMIAVNVNGWSLLALPEYQYAEPDPDDPDATPALTGIEPATPTVQGYPGGEPQIATDAIQQLALISPQALETGGPGRWVVAEYYYPGAFEFSQVQRAFLPGLLILGVGLWYLRSSSAAAALRELAIPLAVAISTPFLVAPLAAIGSAAASVAAGLLGIAGMLPLAAAFADREARADQRRAIHWLIAGLAGAAGLAVVGAALGDPRDDVETLVWVLTGAIALVPGLIAAGPIDFARLRPGSGQGARGLVQSTELAIGGATPMMAAATVSMGVGSPPFIWPLGVWLLAILLAGRFTVRPLARLATRAALQRDLVVAATEAERARLAADIHDDALQELTLLVRRLESAGDAEGAEIGRTVADKLRAICGDLRLPILDDLGVGPALDWLVVRIERLAGGEVRLERTDDARHNPDVELAIFRVAQEALANAVKHGSPPIVVRYRSTPAGISLAVDDAGPGIPDDAPDSAEKAGRFGLLNMAQRAEQIGAILDVKRWPGGGTHVALEWRPH